MNWPIFIIICIAFMAVLVYISYVMASGKFTFGQQRPPRSKEGGEGFFDFDKNPKRERYALLPGGNSLDVVGESNYQGALEKVAGGKAERPTEVQAMACLVREPENPYDRNAVAVYMRGQQVGHLSRNDASQYAPILDDLSAKYMLTCCCVGRLTGGWRRQLPSSGGEPVIDEGDFGVVLGLAEPHALIGDQELTISDQLLATYEEWTALQASG